MASLAKTLQSSSKERLHQLGAVWGVTPKGPDDKDLIGRLLHNMTDRWHLRSRLEVIGRLERQILLVLADSFQHWTLQSELPTRCRASAPEIQDAIESLAGLGLALTEDWQEFQKSSPGSSIWFVRANVARSDTVVILPMELTVEIDAAHRAITQGDVSHVPLRAHLPALSVRDLQAVAKHWGIPRPHEYAKQTLINEILRTAGSASRVWAAAQLNHPQAATLLKVVNERGGKATVADLRQALSDDDLSAAFAALSRAWLIQETYIGGIRYLFLPLEIRLALGSLKEESAPSLSPVQPKGEVWDSHLVFVEDLQTLANFVSQNRVEVTAGGYIHQKTFAKLESLFHDVPGLGEGNSRAHFVVDCGIRLGLAKVEETRVYTGDGADRWLRLSMADKVKEGSGAWMAFPRFEVHHSLEYFGLRISWPNARSRLLKCLAANCKVGEWYDVAAFAGFVYRTDPELLGVDPAGFDLKPASYLQGFDFAGMLRDFVANVLAFPLYWLGFVAIAEASSPEGQAAFFSLTPLGAWALDMPGGMPPPEPSDKPLIVQPNFEIIAIAAGGLVLRDLARFADLVRSDQASVYTLAKASILRGIDSGLTTEEMIEFLGRHAQKEVPQNVAYSIADWGRQYRPLSFSIVSLMEVESEEVLSELLAMKKFSSYFSRRISSTAAILSTEADVKKLSNELRKRGYSPHITGQLAEPRQKPRSGGHW